MSELHLWLLVMLLLALGVLSFYRWHFKSTTTTATTKVGRTLPGPWGWPILGHLTMLDVKAPHKTLQKMAQQYGGIYGLRMGKVSTVVLADPALIREFFRHEEFTARAPLYLTHGIMGGYGIICAEGSLWKQQRRLIIDWLKTLGMTKRFDWTRTQLESRIGRGVDECVQWYQTELSKGLPFNPLPALQHTLGNIINDLVFGVTYARDDITWRYLQHLQEEGVKLIGVSGLINFLPWLRFFPGNRRMIRFLLEGKAKTHALYDRIAADCEMSLVNDGNEKIMGKNEKRVPTSILEMFLRERKQHQHQPQEQEQEQGNSSQMAQLYSAEQLRHLLADMFGAGVDTSLATLRWFLLYMACEQSCQEQLRKELKQLNGMSLAELETLPYLRACIAEVQRIRPVVPLGIPHGAQRDMCVAGYQIAKGSMIIPLQYAIHLDPCAWPEPEVFRPERFLSPTGEYAAPSHFMPFQAGKRMCPGDELARMMLSLYTGRILNRFRLELDNDSNRGTDYDMNGECGITLTPHSYKLRFIDLNNDQSSSSLT